MNFKVKTITVFEHQAKRLQKKYTSLKRELHDLIQQLKENPRNGTPLCRNCYKIRIAIASKGKGKSGGGRVITNLVIADDTVYLLTIYDKSEKEDVSDKELIELLKYIPD